MSRKDVKLMSVADINLMGSGGSLRALRSLCYYTKYFDVYLTIPIYNMNIMKIDKMLHKGFIEGLRYTLNNNIKLFWYSMLRGKIYKIIEMTPIELRKTLLQLMWYTVGRSPQIIAKDPNIMLHIVVAFHETFDALATASILSEKFEVPKIVLLQLPPFYSDKKRIKNIFNAYSLYLKHIFGNKIASYMIALARRKILDIVNNKSCKQLLDKFNGILAISKAIPIEMGFNYLDRIYALDPGIALDHEDLEVIKNIRAKAREKERYIIFGGRPLALKGIVEALIVFKTITKYYSDIKLIVTGRVDNNTLSNYIRLCKRLNIENKVIFTRFIPRRKRLEIVAKAKLMLYPSHIDSYSYAILESLYLATPIVGYRIPALDIYFRNISGVKLVDEGDIEALSIETLDMLNKKIDVDTPKSRGWSEIMEEEINYIRRFLDKV